MHCLQIALIVYIHKRLQSLKLKTYNIIIIANIDIPSTMGQALFQTLYI